MSEIIKKDITKIKNGTLKRECKKLNMDIKKLNFILRTEEKIKISDDMLRKFDKGQRRLSWDVWEIIIKILKHEK